MNPRRRTLGIVLLALVDLALAGLAFTRWALDRERSELRAVDLARDRLRAEAALAGFTVLRIAASCRCRGSLSRRSPRRR
jgi:hypothetical protein